MHRYSRASDYPEIADVEQALADATTILEFVRTKLVVYLTTSRAAATTLAENYVGLETI